MSDKIEWKEARSGQEPSDSEEQSRTDGSSEDEFNSDWGEDGDGEEEEEVGEEEELEEESNNVAEPDEIELPQQESHAQSTITDSNSAPPSQSAVLNSVPVYQRINLNFRRNITALADINQHRPKPTLGDSEPFDRWLDRALVAISPNADLILFASNSPAKMVFIAKLRLEPVNQYTTRPLKIPLDHIEQITSLLCLPIMSTQKTAVGLVDWTALVIGLSSGYVKFYTEQSICLLILNFCDQPVISLKCETQKCNLNARSESHFPTMIDELLVSHKTMSVIVDGLGLFENLRLAKQEAIRNGGHYEPAYSSTNLPSILTCQRWKPDGSSVTDSDSFGTRRVTTFDSLLSDSINFERVPTKLCARTVAFVGKSPFISFCREPKDLSSHSYTEILGSIFSYWNKPEPSRLQQTEVNKPANISLYDKERLATSIVPSPDKRLAAVTDDFGRVLLVDGTNMIVTRIWKGYRSAQCGWVEVQQDPEVADSPRALFLVIYAPKRGLLEVWSAQRGPRVAAFSVGKSCILLYCGYKMFNMRGEQTQRGATSAGRLIDQAYCSNCYLLNGKSETVFAIDLPFTYSLYKYDDLKSRDQLLINELNGTIERESDIEVISDILHRLVLAESIEVSIQRIASSSSLNPNQVVPIMENLVINIMKKYDNHSGETINDEDSSIVELCKRLIRLCAIFKELSESPIQELSLPDEVNQRLIDSYEEHPQEIDEFSEQLGWSTTEILRFLSLSALERSYRKNHLSNPWPSIGEPLTWLEFVSCFDLDRQITVIDQQKCENESSSSSSSQAKQKVSAHKLCIRLKEFNYTFLSQDRVMKTALFMYNRLSETYYRSSRSTTTTAKQPSESLYRTKANSYNILEPSSRLALLFQFWLSTKLCNHWKMWAFLQEQVGQISDELKVISMSDQSDNVLICTWKQIYQLILESDNLFASIIATATIKSDTIRMIQDDEKREKLEKACDNEEEDVGRSSVDWETLCIDAERMALLSQQLEDVFLLNLLLKYSVREAHLIEGYLYRVARISVANIIRAGPTIVSELVAQWAVQSGIRLTIFTQPYGEHHHHVEDQPIVIRAAGSGGEQSRLRYFLSKLANFDNEEHAKELLHHVKSSFPCSLEPDVILLNCIWELCRQWTGDKSIAHHHSQHGKSSLLERSFDGLSLISDPKLKHKVAIVAYKTFFHRMFERLMILVETNGTIASTKYCKARDKIIRKELNIGDDCLEGFVQFICDLSEFMLQTSNNSVAAAHKSGEQQQDQELSKEELELRDRLLALDEWWSNSQLDRRSLESDRASETGSVSTESDSMSNSLIRTTLFSSNLIDINNLIELNRAATLMNLIFRLGIIKAYPITLIGEESRQILQLELPPSCQPQQSSTTSALDNKNQSASSSGSLLELRQKFARKCIINVVRTMADELGSTFSEQQSDDMDDDADEQQRPQQHQRRHYSAAAAAAAIDESKPAAAPKPQAGAAAKPLSSSINRQQPDESSSLATGKHGFGSSPGDNDDQLDRGEADADADDGTVMNNGAMVLFADLLSLSVEWRLNRDELHLELVFELYRCNLDKIGAQISNRVLDQQTLANGLLKIASQRALMLFGLSPHFASGSNWHSRSDRWSIFQPNVSSWLKSIQQEELRRELASLNIGEPLRQPESTIVRETFGVELFVLHQLRQRTKLMLDNITNHLDGQAGRLAHDLLQLLESQTFDKFLESELGLSGSASSKTNQSAASKRVRGK